MAKGLPYSSNEGTSGITLKPETAQAESSRGENGEPPPYRIEGKDFSITKSSDHGNHSAPMYNVPYSLASNEAPVAPFKAIAATRNSPVVTSLRLREHEPTDTVDSPPPAATLQTGDATIEGQLRSASSLSLQTGEMLLSVLQTSYKMHAAVRQLSRGLGNRLLAATDAQESLVHEEAEMMTPVTPPSSSSTGVSPPLASCSATSGAARQRGYRPQWNLFEGLSEAAAELLRHQEFQRNLAESSSSVLCETLRDLLSLKASVKSALPTTPYAQSGSQTWIPFKLSQRVSRVYYYSRGYAEEVASGPLEVSGYTVRLSLTCEIKSREVVLCFRGQFCACTANDNVTWPFRGELELTIHHPTEANGNRVYRLRPTRRQETIMPRLVDNVPIHLAGPIGVSALDEDGLWASGTLHLSIKILL